MVHTLPDAGSCLWCFQMTEVNVVALNREMAFKPCFPLHFGISSMSLQRSTVANIVTKDWTPLDLRAKIPTAMNGLVPKTGER